MAALNRSCLVGLITATTVMPSVGAPPARVVADAFSEVPYPRSVFIWWRPYLTIVPIETEHQIRARLVRLATAAADDSELQQFLEGDVKTAVVYPVLAREGDRGVDLLRRMLSAYSSGRAPDDRWLLTVLALACNDSENALPILRQELRRITEQYHQEQGSRNADVHLPIIDAVSIALARRGRLSYAELEKLGTKDPERFGAILLLGLAYAQKWMPEDKVLALIHDGLTGQGTRAIQESLESGVQTDHVLRSFRDFLFSSRDTWMLAKRIALGTNTLDHVERDYLLTVYLLVLTYQADASQGSYDLDPIVVERYLGADLSPYPQASFSATILKECRSSWVSNAWNRYIAELAGHIRPEDVETARHLAARTGEWNSEKQRLYEPEGMQGPDQEPGVHMYGFTRAGGKMPLQEKD